MFVYLKLNVDSVCVIKVQKVFSYRFDLAGESHEEKNFFFVSHLIKFRADDRLMRV
jgi:hypothetical protein